MYTINNLNVFSDSIEGATLSQMYSALDHEWVVRGVLLPDAHVGYGLPIGGVVSTRDVVVPSWVGYDIGCGVGAIKTCFKVSDITDYKKEIYDTIIDTVPLGVGVYRRKSVMSTGQMRDYFGLECSGFLHTLFDQKATHQAGTLGSGNHFAEIGADEEDNVWILIHSGSRGVGHNCATYYMGIAQPEKGSKEGSFPLDVSSVTGKEYIMDLAFMLEFALLNRAILLNDVLNCVSSVLGRKTTPFTYKTDSALITDERITSFINRNHNHAEYKDGMWIHRKGATHAEKGMYGVITGNMRDGSFIVVGKGCDASLCSSSHGAGRVLGRKQAKRELDTIDFVNTMKDVVCGVSNDPGGLIDESPDAYKNIFTVMEEQQDLVEVKHHIRSLINVKR